MVATRNAITLDTDQVYDRSPALNITSVNNGVVGTTNTVVEIDKIVRESVITIPSQNVAITDTGGANGGQGSLKLYDFPAKRCILIGAQIDLTISRLGTNITTTAAVVASVGTAQPGAGDAALTSTEANIIASIAASLTAGAGVVAGMSGTAMLALAASQSAYLNFAIPDAGIAGNDSLVVAGTVTLIWLRLP